mmetsp:Transcript_2852/g.4862  ORF Transcript_2852/g.4862 Transcript_2852/m.4862 type:complete len:162 (+) Transcript_2852:286-771(+)
MSMTSQTTMRTVSVSRMSLKKDVLSESDFHQGLLEKQSPSFHKLWQKRYFVLSNRLLKYYKSQQDFEAKKPPKGVINFQQVWVDVEFRDQSKIDLKIVGSNRVFNLRCAEKRDFDTWRYRLNHSISISAGFKKKLSLKFYIEDISKFFDFWRFLRIPEDAF